uniref:Uncharacterized protein n=1 Tax=Anguilla anguilla TaxID=7936 RepID=A0A0E9V868_ANGAN
MLQSTMLLLPNVIMTHNGNFVKLTNNINTNNNNNHIVNWDPVCTHPVLQSFSQILLSNHPCISLVK